jgi:hypothetical protein
MMPPMTMPPDTPSSPAPKAPVFADVKVILDRLVAGRSPERMKDAHGDPSFGWATLDQLKSVVVRPNGQGSDPAYRLIDPSLVGNGQGAKTNLVVALSSATGVDFNGKMPLGGPYAAAADIRTIIAWIDAGMPA